MSTSHTSVPSAAPTFEVALTVVEARNLIAADSNGSSDPYVELVYGKNKRLRTKVVEKNLNPTWNEKLSFSLTENEPIHLLCWDKDFIGSDKLGDFDLNVFVYPPCIDNDVWVDLKGVASGKVHLLVHWTLPEGYMDAKAKLLYSAMKTNNVSTVKSLLQEGVSKWELMKNWRAGSFIPPLAYACFTACSVDIVKILIEAGADISGDPSPLWMLFDREDHEFTTREQWERDNQLTESRKQNDALVAELLLKHGALPNQVMTRSASHNSNLISRVGTSTPLIAAIFRSNPMAVKALLDAGGDTTIKSQSGETAWGYALEAGPALFKVLVDHVVSSKAIDLNSDMLTSKKMRLLSQAISTKKGACAIALFEAGADMTYTTSVTINQCEYLLTPLLEACLNCVSDFVLSVVMSGKMDLSLSATTTGHPRCGPKAPVLDVFTASCLGQCTAVIQKLLDDGADPVRGFRALCFGQDAEIKTETIDVLLPGARVASLVNTPDATGHTALYWAAGVTYTSFPTERLLAAGADPTILQGKQKKKVIYPALRYGHPDTAKLLLKGLDMTTPLILAPTGKHLEHNAYMSAAICTTNGIRDKVEALLAAGADVNEVGPNGQTLFVTAVNQCTWDEVCKFLIKKGGAVDLDALITRRSNSYFEYEVVEVIEKMAQFPPTYKEAAGAVLAKALFTKPLNHRTLDILLEKGASPDVPYSKDGTTIPSFRDQIAAGAKVSESFAQKLLGRGLMTKEQVDRICG
ncbi:protein unc-13 A/B/C [Pelomyxa schiedti]|nr:protein unc-13 A/B/C [Pelomyxa schiedti]